MDNLSAGAPAWPWSEMLKFFRALGGIAENLELRAAPTGQGLYPVDESKPVLLHVPRTLLFDTTEIEFAVDGLRLKSTANVGEAERAFFEKYQAVFSWGGRLGAASRAFVAALDGLPPEIRELLIADFGFESLLEGDPESRAQLHFLAGRKFDTGGAQYLAPVLEMADHDSAGFVCEFVNGLQIQGSAPGEIFCSHGVHDALSGFTNWGAAIAEPGAFSLSMHVDSKPKAILIGRNTDQSVSRGKDWAPQVKVEADRIELSYLMIGHRKFHRLSRGIFRTLMREAAIHDADQVFDSVLNFNWSRFLHLLALLEPHEGERIETLRRMARHQLEAMCYCIGSREPDAQPPRAEQIWRMSI